MEVIKKMLKPYLNALALGLPFLLPLSVHATEVGLAGVMGSKALLIINGAPPKAVSVGQVVNGVQLLSVQGEQVMVDIEGKKRPLSVGQYAAGAAQETGGKVVLTADARGHFYTQGTVNGVSIRFMVDTGATMVSLGMSDAKRLGLDLSKATRGVSQTANGQAEVFKVKLDTVKVGEITLNNVDGLVHQTEMPAALLGMSFLNQMEMQRDGSTMTLRKRF